MNSQYYPFTFFNHKITPLVKANVPIMTNALQYGTAVFGGIRGYWRKEDNTIVFFRVDDHFKRLLSALKILNVTLDHNINELKEILIKLIKKNKPKQNCYCRPFAYASSLEMSPNLVRDKKFALAIYMLTLDDYLPTAQGLSLMVSSWRRVSDKAIPARGKISGSYINSALARKEANENGYGEAIFLDSEGSVSEGSAENIFIVRDGKLITPPVTGDILEGITRKTIINLALDLEIPVVERTIDRTELYVADEIFLCGTGAQLSWASEVDKRTIGDGKIGRITSELKKIFFQTVSGKNNKHQNWCLPFEFK